MLGAVPGRPVNTIILVIALGTEAGDKGGLGSDEGRH